MTAAEPLAIRSTEDLLEAFAARKAELELSNDFVDEVGGLTRGHCDKVLGPTRAKRLSPMTLDLFLEVFALEIVVRPNAEAMARMETRWEQRKPDRVRIEPNRVSRRILRRAGPLIFKEMGKIGGQVRNHMLTPKHRRQIARKAARARWKRAKADPDKPRAPGRDPLQPAVPNAPQAAATSRRAVQSPPSLPGRSAKAASPV